MSGGRIVWQSGADGDADVWYGDTSGGATRLLDGTDDRHPDVDDDVVVWQRSETTDSEIFKRDLATTTLVQVTTNDFDDVTPKISGNHIVWVVEPDAGDSEIWVSWNGAAAAPVPSTQDDGRDDVNPQIEGDRFVWESCLDYGQPGEQCEIVLAPEPSGAAASLTALATLVLAGCWPGSGRGAKLPGVLSSRRRPSWLSTSARSSRPARRSAPTIPRSG
jgi:hypothetical protein